MIGGLDHRSVMEGASSFYISFFLVFPFVLFWSSSFIDILMSSSSSSFGFISSVARGHRDDFKRRGGARQARLRNVVEDFGDGNGGDDGRGNGDGDGQRS